MLPWKSLQQVGGEEAARERDGRGLKTAVRRVDPHCPLLADSRPVRSRSRWLRQGVSEANVGLASHRPG